MSVSHRQDMVRPDHVQLSIVQQCMLLKIARSGLYYEKTGESSLNLTLMQEIDRAFTEWPFFGVRQMRRYLVSLGYGVGTKRVRRLMRLMGLMAMYQKPKTSVPNPEHKRYPYLLRDLPITRCNQVWCADITYIPMRKGFLYLVAVMDWHSRKVLSWRLSNTMDTDFCVAALEEALAHYGVPGIFNTDKAVSSPVLLLPTFCMSTASASPWMAAAAGWTTCLSNASGVRSSMKTSTCMPMRTARRLGPASANGSLFIIKHVPTASWTVGLHPRIMRKIWQKRLEAGTDVPVSHRL